VASCQLCGSEARPDVIASSDLFNLGTVFGMGVPGRLVLATNRHVEGTFALSGGEAAELGRWLVGVSAAIREVMNAERVYFAVMGERHPHFHVLFVARPADVASSLRGARMFDDVESMRDDDRAAAVSAVLATRDLLPQP
jgi:hypothetical protein